MGMVFPSGLPLPLPLGIGLVTGCPRHLSDKVWITNKKGIKWCRCRGSKTEIEDQLVKVQWNFE
jgi:hypothetical protein